MNRARWRGMTLIETVVMMGLMTMFGSLAYPMMTNTIRGIQRSQEFAQQFEVGWTVLDDLAVHVRQLQPAAAGQPLVVGEDGGAGAGARDRLTVRGVTLRSAGLPTLCTLEYFVEDASLADATPARMLKRVTTADGAVLEQPLGVNVTGFDCEFLAEGEWHAGWTAPQLPEAIRLVVYVVPRTGVRPRPLYTEITLARGAA